MPTETSATLLRQWEILRLLPAWPQSITTAALKKALQRSDIDVTQRTIQRDLDDMSGRFPIACEKDGRTFRWSWKENAAIETLPRLSVSQCLALILARQHLGDLMPKFMLDELEPLIHAAERQLENTPWKRWARLTAVAPQGFQLCPPKIDPKVLGDVQHALAHRLRLTADYKSIGSEAAKTRTIHPLGLLTRGPVHYLISLLPEYADQPRQLALHRMQATTVGTEACRELYGFSMNHYRRHLAINPRGKIRVRLHFRGTSADHLLGTPISKYQTWRPIPGEKKVEVCGTVEDDREFWRWLLSFGSEVEVMEPEHLRAEMAEEVRKMAVAYGTL